MKEFNTGKPTEKVNETKKDATTGRKATQSGSSERTWVGFAGQMLAAGLAISSPFAAHAEGLRGDAPTALSARDGHGSALKLRGDLGRQFAVDGMTNRPDSLRRHESIAQSELPQVRLGDVELPMPHADDVKAMFQNPKDLKHIDSICQNPQFAKFIGVVVKNENFMGHVRAMCLDQNFVECMSKLCEKPEFNKSLSSLCNDQSIRCNIESIRKIQVPQRRELKGGGGSHGGDEDSPSSGGHPRSRGSHSASSGFRETANLGAMVGSVAVATIIGLRLLHDR